MLSLFPAFSPALIWLRVLAVVPWVWNFCSWMPDQWTIKPALSRIWFSKRIQSEVGGVNLSQLGPPGFQTVQQPQVQGLGREGIVKLLGFHIPYQEPLLKVHLVQVSACPVWKGRIGLGFYWCTVCLAAQQTPCLSWALQWRPPTYCNTANTGERPDRNRVNTAKQWGPIDLESAPINWECTLKQASMFFPILRGSRREFLRS